MPLYNGLASEPFPHLYFALLPEHYCPLFLLFKYQIEAYQSWALWTVRGAYERYICFKGEIFRSFFWGGRETEGTISFGIVKIWIVGI